MRYTASGQSVTSFSIASTRKFTVDGEQREETDWFNVSAWGRLSELCNQYLTKGRQVYIEGSLHLGNFVGRDGQTRWANEIRLTDVQFLSRGPGTGEEPAPYDNEPGEMASGPTGDDVDDLPF